MTCGRLINPGRLAAAGGHLNRTVTVFYQVYAAGLRFGSTSITVTGTESPFSVKTRVIPRLYVQQFNSHCSLTSVQFDLNVSANREIQFHQCVNSLVSRIDNIHQPLVRTNLILVRASLLTCGEINTVKRSFWSATEWAREPERRCALRYHDFTR